MSSTRTFHMKGASWTPISASMCEGWLEGYLLTGRHGFFASYESFIRVVDSMVSQHAKWLKVCNQLPWRQKDRFSEPDSDLQCMAAGPQRLYPSGPGYARPCGEQKADVVRMYLPPDANCLLSCFDHCIPEQELRQCHRGIQTSGACSG